MNNTHPTTEQAEWLKSNYKLYSNIHLAEKLNTTENRISCWLKILKLRKRAKGRTVGALKKKKVNPGPERTIKRLTADHTNPSREQHIDRILNQSI